MTRLSIEEFENYSPPQEPTPERLSLDQFQKPQQEQGFVKRTLGGIKKAFVGQNEFDLPELQSATGEELGGQGVAAKIATGFLLEPSQEGRVSIIRNFIPDARFKRDKYENIIADINGKEFALNKSGLSMQDFLDVGSEVAKFLPAARGAAVATKGAALVPRAIAQGAAAMTTEIASNPLARSLGSEEPVDLGRVMAAGLFAGGGELALPVLSKIGKYGKRILKGDKLTNKEKGDLILQGVDPEDLTPEFIRDLVKKEGATPAEKAAIIESKTLPREIPQSTGDITRSPRTQLFETEAEKGAFGEVAGEKIRGFRRTQQEAIDENIRLIKEGFGGGDISTPTEAGRVIQNKLANLRDVARKEVSEAYKAAQETKAFIPKDSFSTISNRAKQSLIKQGYDFENVPEVTRLLKNLDDFQERITKIDATPKFNNIETIRKRVNANIIGSPDYRIKSMGSTINRVIDDVVDDYIDGGLLSGNKEAVTQIRNARGQSRQFKKLYDDKDVVASLVETKGYGDRSLKVDADDAINFIFGKNSISKRGIASDVKKLKSILPSEEVGALKQAAFLRLIGDQRSGKFSGLKFSKNLEKALKESPEAMSELFTADELKLAKKFAKVSQRVTTKEFGGINTSSTGVANQILSGIDNIFGSAGRLATGLVRKGSAKGKELAAESRAIESITGAIPKKPVAQSYPAVTGVIAGQQLQKDQNGN